MSNNVDYCDCLYEIWNCKNVGDARKYLKNIRDNYEKLNHRQAKKYLQTLNEMCEDNFVSNSIKDFDLGYGTYYAGNALRKIILDNFVGVDFVNFYEKVDEMLLFFDSFIDKPATKRMYIKDIDNVFNVIKEKMPEFSYILTNINLDIMIFNNGHKAVNSAAVPSSNFRVFRILCFYMMDNEEYRQRQFSPIYVFLHELGHIVCWLLTKEFGKVPDSFFDAIKKYMVNLKPGNPDAFEVFADCFAMAVMYNSSLSDCNPFTCFPEEFYIELEKYFSEVIKEIKFDSVLSGINFDDFILDD